MAKRVHHADRVTARQAYESMMTETMPTDACQWFYECDQCHVVLKPKPGDCCVYCSYGTVPCPPIQEHGKGSCCSG